MQLFESPSDSWMVPRLAERLRPLFCVCVPFIFFSFTFPAYSSPFSPSSVTFCPFPSRLPLVSHPFSSLPSSPNPLLLLGTPHFAGAPSQTEQGSYCLLRESRWNRFHNVIIPHMEATVLPEKTLRPLNQTLDRYPCKPFKFLDLSLLAGENKCLRTFLVWLGQFVLGRNTGLISEIAKLHEIQLPQSLWKRPAPGLFTEGMAK